MEGKEALALGPGLGRRPATTALVQALVELVSLPTVIDADGLNALADDITILRRKKSADLVLTPHPGEMARLLGNSVPDVEADRLEVAREFARDFGVYLVLKGARTIIASPTGLTAINGSGNPGMASGGMGDVLTGIIVSLLGQRYSTWDACRLGVFLHGYAADLVTAEKGESGISASDVREMLPYAYNTLLNNVSSSTTCNHTRRQPVMQTVADIMTKDVVTVTKETTVRELAQIFESRHFGSLPVVDGTGCLTGIVTASDLIEQGRSLHIPTVISLFDWVIPLQGERSLERDLQKMTAQTVGEICATDVVTVTPSDPVSTAADTMSRCKLHALPVVDGKKLVGMVSRIDIIRNIISS
jgi:CBS domain-containing protein